MMITLDFTGSIYKMKINVCDICRTVTMYITFHSSIEVFLYHSKGNAWIYLFQ